MSDEAQELGVSIGAWRWDRVIKAEKFCLAERKTGRQALLDFLVAIERDGWKVVGLVEQELTVQVIARKGDQE